MDYYGVDKPMWLTETATLIVTVKCGDNLSWHNTVAKGVIKRYAQALANNVEKVFWFGFVGLPTVEEEPRGVECGEPTNFLKGGLGWDVKPDSTYRPRPAYYTYQLMTSKLTGFTLVEKITDTQYKFTVNNKDIYLLWCDTDKCSLPSGINGMVKVTDYLGNEETKQAFEIILTESPVFIEDSLSTSIEHKSGNLTYLNKFYLLQNYPNPFNPVTKIEYNLPKSNNVTLKIFNIAGQEIIKLVDEFQQVGEHEVLWQAKELPSGIYFYRLQAGDPSTRSPYQSTGQAGQGFSETKKLIFQK